MSQLQRATLTGAHLERAILEHAQLQGANLHEAQLQGANLERALGEDVHLVRAELQGANLSWTHLQRASLYAAQLQGANLRGAQLEGAHLDRAHLQGANLTAATFDKASHLNSANLTGVSLDQVTFDNVNLTVVDWSVVPVLGDELTAEQDAEEDGKSKDVATRRDEYAAAVRANRVLAVTLRGQGLSEDADRYAYRAQVLQRAVLRRQGQWGRAFGSWLLDAVSGYRYKPMRSVWTYSGVILAFAATYFAITNFGITPFLPTHSTHSTPLAWYEALVLSISSFHGRGLFPTGLSLGDPLAMFAAAEAIIGLLIEITFIATFTQRFLAR